MRYSDIVAFWLSPAADASVTSYSARAYNMSGVPIELPEGSFTRPAELKNPDALCILSNDGDEKAHTYSKYQIRECLCRVVFSAAEFVHAPHYAIKEADALLKQLWNDDKGALRSGLQYYHFLQLSYTILKGILLRSRQVDRGIVTMKGECKLEDTLHGVQLKSNHAMKAGSLLSCDVFEITECWCMTEPTDVQLFFGLGMNKYRVMLDLADCRAVECLLLTAESAIYSSLLLDTANDASAHEYTYTIEAACLPLLLEELREL